MHTLVLLRHGESTWNLANRFLGVDRRRPHAETGRVPRPTFRRAPASRRRSSSSTWPITSVLKRAIRTLWIALDEMDRMWLPVRIATGV